LFPHYLGKFDVEMTIIVDQVGGGKLRQSHYSQKCPKEAQAG
jgi:hypothetical protein